MSHRDAAKYGFSVFGLGPWLLILKQESRMHPQKKMAYHVKLRRQKTGEEHDRLIFAKDEATARARAVVRARWALGTTFLEREYGQFEVLSCALAK
jgi:hypothetical protein